MTQTHRAPQIARLEEVLATLRRRFPSLAVDRCADAPGVDALVRLPVQTGLEVEIDLSLQNNDELHLTAGHFWVEWFPCHDQRIFDDFMDAVVGLISGRYRIVEQFVRGRPTQAKLQRPEGDGWRTVASWANLLVLLPWPRIERVVRNRTPPTR
jgi:hypothetical protein